ncbi:hypothetical protein Bca101_101686 [Brassica carinata]
MVVAGDGELGFDSERSLKAATTSKEGSGAQITQSTREVVTINNNTGLLSLVIGIVQSKSLNEDPLEGKSGASSADFDPIVLAGIGVMINEGQSGHSYFIVRERKLGARRRSDTVLVSTISDADQGSADASLHGRLLRGTMAFRPRKFEAITESVNHRVFERKLRPKPYGEARLLGVTNRRPQSSRGYRTEAGLRVLRARLAKIELRMPGRQAGSPLSLSISISGGKETNKDSLSSGEREEPSLKIGRLGVGVVWKRPQRRTGPKFPGKGRQRAPIGRGGVAALSWSAARASRRASASACSGVGLWAPHSTRLETRTKSLTCVRVSG